MINTELGEGRRRGTGAHHDLDRPTQRRVGRLVSTTLLPGPRPWPARDAPLARAVRLGTRSYRYVPPSIRDPRIHLSVVILTILFIGIGWLGFRVSIAQIIVTLATCAAIELAMTYRRTAMFVWPASALQTGTSTALLFRVIGTENGDYWTLRGWYLFAAVGALGLLSKYVIRFRSGHVFNPSNIALVAAFLVLGSGRVEPLDFWWAPFDWPMAAAYAVIVAGGLFICSRLRLLGLGAALWLSLAAGIGVLALADHSITARWSFTPITGTHFWWIIMTSPEILIFLFFMITDPRTVPSGRVARIAYGTTIGVVSTVLIAPWETEFGAKVGLLSGLVIVCAARPLFDRYFPAAGSEDDHPGRFLVRALSGGRRQMVPAAVLPRVAAGTFVVGLLAAVITVAGWPARSTDAEAPFATDIGTIAEIDPAILPTVTIDPQVAGLSAGLATPEGAQQLAATLAWNLQVEAEALSTGDASLLPAITDGARLHDLEALIEAGSVDGQRVIPSYTFDSLDLMVVFPGGFQRGANAGLAARGTVEEVVRSDSGDEIERRERPFEITFSLRQTTSGRWLNTDTLPYGTGADPPP